MKRCKECGQTLSIESFPKAGNKGTGRRARCSPCHNERERRLRLERARAEGRTLKQRAKFDPDSGVRLCRSCEVARPLAQFSKGQRECRSCKSARYARYRADNADKEAERRRVYHEQNREQLRARGRAHRKIVYYRDPERERQARRDYWRALTLEQRREALRRQRESRYRSWALWRARKLNTQTGPISRRAIIERDASTCYLCRTVVPSSKIELDHVVPLSRGGTHTEDNIKVACSPCNRWKSDRLLSEL